MPSLQRSFVRRKRMAPIISSALLAAALLCCFSVGFSPIPTRLYERYSPTTSILDTFDRCKHAFPLYLSQKDKTVDTAVVNVSGVTLKMAFDEQWAVADDAEIKSERFTCSSSLDLVHRLRRDCDCVLVGRGTVERDNCTLTVRRVPFPLGNNKQPVRVVVDPRLSLLYDNHDSYAIFQDGLETLVYCSQAALLEKKNHEMSLNPEVTLVPLPTSNDMNDYKLSTADIVNNLNERGIHHVMVEGGPATALPFLSAKLVDRAILIRAPISFSEPILSGMSTETLTNAGLELLGSSTSDGDVVEYWSRPDLPWPTEDLTDWP